MVDTQAFIARVREVRDRYAPRRIEWKIGDCTISGVFRPVIVPYDDHEIVTVEFQALEPVEPVHLPEPTLAELQEWLERARSERDAADWAIDHYEEEIAARGGRS